MIKVSNKKLTTTSIFILYKRSFLVVIIFLLFSIHLPALYSKSLLPSSSSVSLNLAYQNPYSDKSFGLNLLHAWKYFAYEVGVNIIKFNNDTLYNKLDSTVNGSLSLKYIFPPFSYGNIFIQAGHHFSVYKKDSSVNKNSTFDMSYWYSGVGMYLGNLSSFYFYTSLNYLQAGFIYSNIGVGFCIW